MLLPPHSAAWTPFPALYLPIRIDSAQSATATAETPADRHRLAKASLKQIPINQIVYDLLILDYPLICTCLLGGNPRRFFQNENNSRTTSPFLRRD